MVRKRTIAKDILAVITATLYLVLYCIFLQFESTRIVALLMLGFAPLILTGMVLAVLILGKYTGRELGDDEFGYSDKNNDDLGVF